MTTNRAFVPHPVQRNTHYNHACRTCAACRQSRSLGQYDGDSARCKRCVARGIAAKI